MDKPMARTFYDDESIEVEILDNPSSTGLTKVKYEDKVFARNKVQLHPMNDAAKAILGK